MLSPEFGHFCLILALVASAMQILLPIFGLVRSDSRLTRTAEGLQLIASIAIFISFASLVCLYRFRLLGAAGRQPFTLAKADDL